MRKKEIKTFLSGVHNKFDAEIIKEDSYQDALGWVTKDGAIEIARGREIVGAEGGIGSAIVHIGYKTNGDKVLFRKTGTKVQYFDGTTWQDTITGLTADAPITFSNYSSLAGAFVYVFSTDGIWKIVTANPGSSTALYDSAKNFKGLGLIDKGRTIMWGLVNDPTGLYGSKIDAQNSTVYTTVSGEAIADVASGTLAFKAGGATRTCFAVQITDTSSGEVFTDNFDGTLTGSLGNSGTINYTTGAFTITGQSGAGTANYQWENSNAGGLTDFTKSTPRTAGQGFTFRQDIGGDAIKQVLVIEGIYYSLKENSIYSLQISDDDLDADNNVFRNNVGVPSNKSGVATSNGILLIDTARSNEPLMRIITRNQIGDNFDLLDKFMHFKFANYVFDDAVMESYGEYVLLACRTPESIVNNRLLICDYNNDTVDIVPFSIKSFAQDGDNLYTGDSLSQSVFLTLNGFDDYGAIMQNFVITKNDDLGSSTFLKKIKKLVIRGLINPSQNYDVYAHFDGGSRVLVGNVSGQANYVDTGTPVTIGANMIGTQIVGGEGETLAYPYMVMLKIKTPQFRVRALEFVANSLGYISIQSICDWDIIGYREKLAAKFRQKQNVSINSGDITDLPNPNY
jgi:hypothetical protein